jgi:DNA-binding transcriptional ArsR family regulator
MKNEEQNMQNSYNPNSTNEDSDFNYNHVFAPARVAIYDDLLSSPRIIEIQPADTRDFIENLATQIYTASHDMGGDIPYHAIRQMSENFIHAKFKEVVVSILDKGNTIRFTDQGPGIPNKELAQQPGFSSATKEMKLYIDGVGSGLPIVSEYLNIKDGSLSIEDNLNGGSVVTLSLKKTESNKQNNTELYHGELQNNQIPNQPQQEYYSNQNQLNQTIFDQQQGAINQPQMVYNQQYQQHNQYGQLQPTPIHINQGQNFHQQHNINGMYGEPNNYFNAMQSITSALSERMLAILKLMLQINPIGVTELKVHLDIPQSSASNELKKLEESGLVQKIGTKRQLTPYGFEVASSLQNQQF